MEERNGRQMAIRRSDVTWRVVMSAMGLVVAIDMAVMGWLINRLTLAHEKIAELNIRLVQIESTRYTTRDGIDLLNRISQIEQKIPKKVPPEWFEKEVRLIESKQALIIERLNLLEKRRTR